MLFSFVLKYTTWSILSWQGLFWRHFVKCKGSCTYFIYKSKNAFKISFYFCVNWEHKTSSLSCLSLLSTNPSAMLKGKASKDKQNGFFQVSYVCEEHKPIKVFSTYKASMLKMHVDWAWNPKGSQDQSPWNLLFICFSLTSWMGSFSHDFAFLIKVALLALCSTCPKYLFLVFRSAYLCSLQCHNVTWPILAATGSHFLVTFFF